MKTLQPSKDSWHWKLTSRMWDDWRLQEDDFCTYTRKLVVTCVAALFLCVLLIAGTAFIIWTEAAFIWWVILSIIHLEFQSISKSWLELMPVGAFITFVACALGIMHLYIKGKISLFWAYGWILKISCDKIPMCPETKDFLSHAYESFHDKVCFKMEWKD